jgi:Ankyrin repeats (3 copies)
MSPCTTLTKDLIESTAMNEMDMPERRKLPMSQRRITMRMYFSVFAKATKNSLITTAFLVALGIWVGLTWAEDSREELLGAAAQGDLEKIGILLKDGADVNVKDQNERTALMLPAWAGQFEVVKFLLEKGADVNARDKNGRTAMMWATDQGETKIIELLRTHRHAQ